MTVSGSRRRDQPAPPHAVFEALTDPFRPEGRQWLVLAADEVAPRVLEATSPVLVVWSSIWPGRPADRIRFDLEPSGSGCWLRWTLETEGRPVDDRTLARQSSRLDFLINGELRYSFG